MTTTRAGRPGWLRCSSAKYSRYSRSSRLAIRAPRSAIWSLFNVDGPLAYDQPMPRLLIVLLTATTVIAQTATRPPQNYEALARDILRELVGVNTTHAKGTTAAARAVAARALAAGFPASDVHVLAPPDHPTQGNAVIRLRGRGADRPVLYIAHLDVVEARRDDWTFDPLQLTERDGWLYGRGTIDMKGQDAALL